MSARQRATSNVSIGNPTMAPNRPRSAGPDPLAAGSGWRQA